MATKESLLQELREFNTKHGRFPTRNELTSLPELHSKNTYTRVFGSFNVALLLVGGTPPRADGVVHSDCENCGCNFKARRSSGKRFCSTTCANIAKTKIVYCGECGEPHTRNSQYCKPICRMTSEMKSIVIGDLTLSGDQNRYRAIRDRAKNFYMLYGRSESCLRCGYDKHVENCHVNPISEFPLTTTMWEINKPGNVISLCPNCHWEFDSGNLTLEEIIGE